MSINYQNNAMGKMKQLCGQPEKFEKKIIGKEFLLGKYFDGKKTTKINKKPKKYTKSKIQGLLNIQQKIVSKERTFEFYTPLQNLWHQYMSDLLKNDHNEDSIFMKLLKADLHGAYFTIIHSNIDSYIGLEGLVINQSLKTFKIINKVNKIVTILKEDTVFQAKVMDKYYCINGNCLVYRSIDRMKHKFKFKKAEKINMKFISILMHD